MSAKEHLQSIHAADLALIKAEDALLRTPQPQLVALLSEAVLTTTQKPPSEETGRELARLADLCSQVPGPEMMDAMLLILNQEDPAVRVAVQDVLLEVAYERYAEFARGVDRVMSSDDPVGPAMSELPFMIAEIAEPSALPLLKDFLAIDHADVVAATVEAMVELGDAEAIDLLTPMTSDTRMVGIEGFEQETEASIGKLASEAIEILRGSA